MLATQAFGKARLIVRSCSCDFGGHFEPCSIRTIVYAVVKIHIFNIHPTQHLPSSILGSRMPRRTLPFAIFVFKALQLKHSSSTSHSPFPSPHHTSLLTPTASNTSGNGKTLQPLTLPQSHFLNAHLKPSGTATPPSSSPVVDRNTTLAGGTNGRSSAEAARMAYSCANKRAARKGVAWEERR